MKRVSQIIVASAKELSGTKKYASRALVLNETTGELRRGPGTWAELAPYGEEVQADIEVATVAVANVTIATGLIPGQTVNGKVLVAGDVVLLTGQSAPEENGFMVADDEPFRHPGYATFPAHAGTVAHVAGGTDAGALYLCTNTRTGTLDTTPITFRAHVAGTFAPVASAVADTDTFTLRTAAGTQSTVTAAVLKAYFNAQ